MTSFRFSLFFVLVLVSLASFSQITYPINVYNGQTIDACSGIFTDSGGSFETPYSPNEDYSITFCSSDGLRPVLDIFFEHFHVGQGDVLFVYDGSDESAPLLWEATGVALEGKHIYASSGCLHFRFVSSPSGQGNGWSASLECLSICETFQANINPLTGSFEYCPETGDISFQASAGYLPENLVFDPSQISFLWLIEGTSYGGSQATHYFFDPGAYSIHLEASDAMYNCDAYVTEVIKLGTYPRFDGTMSTADTACASETFSLIGVAHPTIWTGFPTEVVETAAIPDGTGAVYESSLNFDIFGEDDVILSALDVDRVCLKIEHAVNGQLKFELECPSGNRIILKDYSSGSSNLGEPVLWDDVTPGLGYQYCFSNDATYGTMAETAPQFHEYTDQAGNYYFNAAYLPAGTYTPDDNFNVLTGCPLNGEWTLRVKDQVPGDNGFIFSWSLYFKDEFYPDSLIFFPEITQRRWYKNSNALQGNPVAISVDEPGDYNFRFEVTDSFGCTYDTIVTVYIRPLPEAEILSELELPVCEGDSTLLTISPINDVSPDWSFQWSFNNVDISGAIYDTLIAKTPGSYTVRVFDNITGCFNFFTLDVTQQNCDLTIPNVFTPNNDGINDYFEILNLEYYQAEIVIFNRWGKKVFEHSDYYNNWWDGQGAADGTYYYIITYTRRGERKMTEGVITIIR